MSIVRKIKNISNASLPIRISPSMVIYIAPGEILENREVYNLGELEGLVEVKQDLSEIKPVVENKQYLKG